jgi:plasmid stabilization system protein ParE
MAIRPRRVTEETVRLAMVDSMIREDHPRAIDAIIDYFGDRDPAAWRRCERDIGSSVEPQPGQAR